MRQKGEGGREGKRGGGGGRKNFSHFILMDGWEEIDEERVTSFLRSQSHSSVSIHLKKNHCAIFRDVCSVLCFDAWDDKMDCVVNSK